VSPARLLGGPTLPALPMLISIVTVNLNDAPGLRATAASVVAQQYREREWLVIDGGSTDRSQEVIEAFAAEIAFSSSAPDRGVYDAMNRGLRRARGAYVVFMNAGDRFAEPTSLGRIAAALDVESGPDLLLGGTMLHLPSGRQIYRPPRAAVPGLRFGPPAYHQAIAFRRAAHRLVPYDLVLRVSADYGAIAALIARGASARRLDRPLAIRRCDPDSLSERETRRRFADFVRVQREILGKPWPEIAVNLARLTLVFAAYRALRGRRLPPAPRRITAPSIQEIQCSTNYSEDIR
jgi:putative colanic acid biosynthesis glycosyltransferase